MKLVVLLASPQARLMCPPEYIEGHWIEVPDHINEAEFGWGDYDHVTGRLEHVTAKARPNGQMRRREYDGATAPVWEVVPTVG